MRNIYEHSFLYTLTNAVSTFIMKLWKGSLFRQVLYNDFSISRHVEQSKLLNLLQVLIEKSQAIFMPTISNSFIYRLLVALFNSLSYGSIRNYAFLCFGFAVITLIHMFIANGFVLYESVLYGSVLVLGFILYFIKPSFAQLYNGSWVAKQIGHFFGLVEISNEHAQNKDYDSFKWLFLAVGLCLGALYVTLDLLNFIMVFGGIALLFLVLFKLEAGIYTAVFLMPIFPTRYIIAVCAICILSYTIKLFFTGKAKLNFSLTDLFVLLFALLIIYSVFISYMPSRSLFMAFSYVLFICFYFVVKNTINTKEQLFALISIMLASGFIVAAYGIVQRLTGVGFVMTEAWIDTEMFEETSMRVYSTLENPNVLGEYLLFVIPLALAGLYYFKSYMHKFISLVILAVAGLCMVLTLSRGAWLGLILSAVLFTLIKDRRLIWLGIFIVIMIPIAMPQSIVERFTSIGDLNDSSSSYRLNIWLASLQMVSYFWPIGIGLGTDAFISIYQRFAFNAVYAPHSHNLFLQIIIELGIWGIMLFLLIMLTFFKNFLTQISKTRSSFYTAVSAALCAGMGGYLLQGLTDHVWYNYRIVAFFWVVVALSGCLNKFMKEDALNA